LAIGHWSFAQEAAVPAAPKQETAAPQAPAPKPEEQTATVESLTASDNVTLDFKEADIRNVLKIISYKAGVNIVTTPEVIGNVTIRLTDVPWEKALNVILKTYGFAYEKTGNIITVAPIDKLTSLRKQEVDLAQVQPTVTEVFTLRYIDAQDAKKALEPQLSARGKITVLEMTTQAGWEFASVTKGEGLTKQKREGEDKPGRSKTLIISDIPPAMDKLKEVIAQIDVMPQQVLIETRIMEVSRNKLKDIGFDWGTGKAGASGYATAPTDIDLNSKNISTIAGRNLSSEFTPGSFNPTEGTAVFPGTYPYKAGLEVLFKKVAGTQFEVILHALEEDVNTNTLSAPRVMALSNQEASILIGTKYPILKSETSSSSSTAATILTTTQLDYYQDIGIQLSVVPQVCAGEYINMVVHPSVTSYTTTKGTNEYPVIDVREAEARIMMRDGETVVIGGLLKDIKGKENIGIPFLSKIPILGNLFTRETNTNTKIDLLVFLTARIVNPGATIPEEIAKLETRLKRDPETKEVIVGEKKKGKK
jgi:type IV pilus assembly protein PilQ